MTTEIIELRQQDGKTYRAGDFYCSLNNQQTLNEGDQIVLLQSYIDNKNASSNKIIIDEPLILHFENLIYYTDFNNNLDARIKGEYVDKIGQPSYQALGEDFIAYKFTDGAPTAGFTHYISSTWETYDASATSLTFSYINIEGGQVTFYASLPEVDMFSKTVIIPMDFIAKTGSVSYIENPPLSGSEGWELKSYQTSPDPIDVGTYDPLIFKLDITVPARQWDALDLAQYISLQLSVINVNVNNSMNPDLNMPNTGITPFLQQSSNFFTGGTPYGFTTALTEPINFISSQCNNKFVFMSNDYGKLWVGTNQIALNFNTENNMFEWDYLHMPIYSDSGSIIARTYTNANVPNYANVAFTSSKNGGIAWTSLSAKSQGTGKRVDFWEKIMGFDLSKVCVNIHEPYLLNTNGLSGKVRPISLLDGVNTTKGLYGLDTLVVKTSTWYSPNPPGYNEQGKEYDQYINIDNVIQDTIKINSSFTLEELLNTYSHYLIKINLKINQSFISCGGGFLNNIQGIVNKYQSYSSYTYSGEESGLNYIHQGEPVFFDGINIQIVKSTDKKVDEKLGNDNSFYLAIRRGQPQQQQQKKKSNMTS